LYAKCKPVLFILLKVNVIPHRDAESTIVREQF